MGQDDPVEHVAEVGDPAVRAHDEERRRIEYGGHGVFVDAMVSARQSSMSSQRGDIERTVFTDQCNESVMQVVIDCAMGGHAESVSRFARACVAHPQGLPFAADQA